MPGRQQRSHEGGLQHPHHQRIDPGAQGRGQPAVDLETDPVPEVLHIGVGAEQGHGAGIDQGRALRGEHDHGPHGVGQAHGHRGALGRRHRRQGLHPPPQHLGQQVVLGAEVGVGRGRRHPGPSGHVAHGQPGVAHLFDLLGRGLHQLHDHAGLAGAQPTPGPLEVVAVAGLRPGLGRRSSVSGTVTGLRRARGCGVCRPAWVGTRRWPRWSSW